MFFVGRYWGWGVKRDKIGNFKMTNTRVGFDRTGVSAQLDGIVFCALSSGHCPRNPCFKGVWKSVGFHEFCFFVGGVQSHKIIKCMTKIVGFSSPELSTHAK